jgi:hypothetical protein
MASRINRIGYFVNWVNQLWDGLAPVLSVRLRPFEREHEESQLMDIVSGIDTLRGGLG